MSLFRNLFNSNERELRKLSRTVETVSKLEPDMRKLTDSELQAKTGEFRERVSRGESLDSCFLSFCCGSKQAARA